MVEVVEAKGGVVLSAEPPCVADILLVVPLAVGEVVGGVCLGAVEREGLRIGVQTDDAINAIASEGLRYEIGVESVEEVVCLVWERWR